MCGIYGVCKMCAYDIMDVQCAFNPMKRIDKMELLFIAIAFFLSRNDIPILARFFGSNRRINCVLNSPELSTHTHIPRYLCAIYIYRQYLPIDLI